MNSIYDNFENIFKIIDFIIQRIAFTKIKITITFNIIVP